MRSSAMSRRCISSPMPLEPEPPSSPIADLPGVGPAKAALRDGLLDRWPALFLDYDGTLTPIVDDPDKALLPDAVRQTLAGLAALCPVAIVSGRDLGKLRTLVALDGLVYAGSHGFEMAGPPGSGLDREWGAGHLPDLDAAEADLLERLAGLPGVAVERKRFDIAVHTRNARPADVPRVHAIVEGLIGATHRLRLGPGKDVLQVQPNLDWNKGRAVGWLMEARRLDPQTTLPVYIGDDITDEDGFRAMRPSGIGLIVRDDRPRRTMASYVLNGPEAVWALLDWLAGTLKAGRPTLSRPAP